MPKKESWKRIISEQLKKHLGIEPKSSKRTFFVAFVLTIFLFGISNYASFKLGHFYENSERYGDVQASLGQFSKDSNGEYFPVFIINSGTLDLSNIDVRIKTCHMDNFEQLPPIKFLAKGGGTQPIRFANSNTISAIQQKKCDLDYNFRNTECVIEKYMINSTELHVPKQNCSIYLCEYCPYEISINSSELSEEKKTFGWFVSPREIKFTVSSNYEIPNVDVKEMNSSGRIKVNLFTDIEVCLYDKDCPFYQFSQKFSDIESEFYSYLFNQLPFDLVITFNIPKKKDLVLTIHYTDEQTREIIEKAQNTSLEGKEITKIEKSNGQIRIYYREKDVQIDSSPASPITQEVYDIMTESFNQE